MSAFRRLALTLALAATALAVGCGRPTTPHPEIADALNQLGGQISDEDMQALNYAVDEEGLRASQAARDVLVEKGLLPEEFEAPARDAAAVSIGGKQFTEQEVLGEIMALMIEAHAGLRVNRRLNLGGTMICFNALRAGDLDLYAEYTGTGLVNILDEEPTTDPEATYARVQEAFGEQYGLAWLEPLGFNNTYTLTMRRQQAEEIGIRTISDLAEHVRSGDEPVLTAAFDDEFFTRPDGYPGLAGHYGFQFARSPRQMDIGLMYRACADGTVDVINAFATDGRIQAYDLVVLEDDKDYFPPYFAAPLVRSDVLGR